MKSKRSLQGFLHALGYANTFEGPDVGISFAYPVGHLLRHPFPHGCGQVCGRLNSPGIAGVHSFGRLTAGQGGLHVTQLSPPATSGATAIIMFPRLTLLTEANLAQQSRSELPVNNGLTSTAWIGTITTAQLATVLAAQRYVVDFSSAVLAHVDWSVHWVLPPGYSLYLVQPTVAVAMDMSYLGWESCPD